MSIHLPTVIAGAIAVVPTVANLPITEAEGAIRYVAADDTLYTFDGSAWTAVAGGGGGSGTVTSVSVTTANGVSGSVANPTTTPAISLTLGAITPSSVAAVGAVTGSNLSGTNTGDQTITLTGDVTGSGTGSFAATVASVGTSSAANVHSAELLANAATAANTASAIVRRDGSGNFAASTITAALTGTASGNPPNSRSISTTAPLSGGGDLSADRTLSIPAATSSADGYLSSADWTTFNNKQSTSEKAQPNGYASLDGGGKIPAAQLPNSVMEFLGAWDASTNTPTLADGTGNSGDVYRVSVAGTQNLGSGAQTFGVGDWVMYNGSIWQHSPATDAVTSVNSMTGAVTITFASLSPLTTKGDLLTFSTVNTRLPVGSDGQVLTADSGQAPGVKWATPATSSGSSQNFLYNAGFDLLSRGSSFSIPGTTTAYVLDRWYLDSAFDAPGVIDFNTRPGAVDGSAAGAELVVSSSPTTPLTNAGMLYQTLDNVTSRRLYNQTASFSCQIKAEGNVTQVAIAFMYATTETKVTTPVSTDTLVSINAGGFTLCQILNEALGTAMTTDGVVGVRVYASAVSTGDVSDAGNGIVIEQAGVYLGSPASTWVRMYPTLEAERVACNEFYESSYAPGVLPGTAFSVGGAFSSSQDVNGGVDNYGSVSMQMKRVTPSVNIWAPDGTSGTVLHYKAGGAAINQAVSVPKIARNLFVARSPNTGAFMEFNWTADAEI